MTFWRTAYLTIYWGTTLITSPGQLMRHGFTGQHAIVAALGQLALVKTLGGWLKAQSKLRGLHRRPRQIRIPIFDVARPFPFAIADLLTVYTAAIRGIVSHGGKTADYPGNRGDQPFSHRGNTADRPGFQGNRLRQDRPDARHSEQLLVGGRVVQTLMDDLLQRLDLLPQTV